MAAPTEGPTGAEHRSGFVALVGRPNVGKSTLMNRLSGQRLAIVSPRPQTTRNRITAIRTTAEAQIIYVDTPGLHVPHGQLGEFMAETTARALTDVDAVVLICEAPGAQVDSVGLEALAGVTVPVALALNKIDRLRDKTKLLALLQAYATRYPFRALVPLSAVDGTGVGALERVILDLLPPGPPLYPPDTITDQPETFFVAEVVREQVFRSTRQEVPYATAVRVAELVERPGGRLYIRAVLFVEEATQKAILIGAGGAMLKHIGQGARRVLEGFFGVPVYLALWVEVRPDWRRDPKVLRELGYRLTS